MTDFWTTVLTFAQDTTLSVGQHLLQTLGQAKVEEKDDGSLVTTADRWADETLRTAIQQTFPDHGVLSEEVAHVFPDSDWCWIIDPIDGTTNFARGIPLWAISLGLLYRGTPVFGYVYIPPLQQAFHGYWPGQSSLNSPTGAYLNGQPIHTSPAAPGKNQFFSLCARSTGVLAHPFPCKIRMLGVASYNLLTVAAGYTLGAVEATPKIWDIAAVWAIVQAAGGHWTALNNAPLFPLTVGKNYAQHSYPTLASSQTKWVDTFQPLVQSVVKSQE
ncbi:inositol monophosphatase family protein [Pseudanabaena sp. FACHB-2040]|uniref:inositol monophosphatase family protein n=1 Tax=Pseudanabaena sp. FACHB-2040 TaxID=2692859 RepID=UPI0016864956|nr:inositol monophosphatase family protein [Pseudanabaena sp. FACHB-2040]MBD2258140.1 inositol monophosphatase [Pseudanabaena sp. FACHB-2040]